MYGDFDLKLGDSDVQGTFGGRSAPAPATVQSGPSSTVSTPAHVNSLQRDLLTLGFRLFAAPTGTFDLDTEWAVREFQIYAKMERVAKEDTTSSATEYTERLGGIDTGTSRYSGPVSGALNPGTRELLQHWLAESWRCPVVIDAWSKGASPARQYRNIWHHDEVTKSGLIVKAFDFSGYYGPLVDGAPRPVGMTTQWKHNDTVSFGPWGDPVTSPPEMEVLPESTIGMPWDALSEDFRSTFKLVRCVANIECKGFFDIITAYDYGIMSTGLIQWTFAKGTGELSDFLSDYADRAPADYQRTLVFFGLDVRAPEIGGRRTGKPAVRLQAADSTFVAVGSSTVKLDYLRNWHWVYRFVLTARTSEVYRRAMWSFVVNRIVKILGTELHSDVVATRDADGAKTYPWLGEVFTSELAVGILLRWDVNRPVDVSANGTIAGKIPTAALEDAQRNAPPAWSADPSTWTQREEDALIAALKNLAEGSTPEVKGSIPKVSSFPTNDYKEWKLDTTKVTALSSVRGSYRWKGVAELPRPQVTFSPTLIDLGSVLDLDTGPSTDDPE